jgi:voltage-gated potassium channel
MTGKLYTPVRLPGVANLLVRLGVILSLLASTVLVLYLERGLVDSKTGEHPGFVDCIYFAMVTITTVGYGDIVPVSIQARLIDAFLLTPVRLIFIFTFLGTAYQLAIKRFQEEYRMKRAVDKLNDHVIVCGYGATGRAAVQELLLQGWHPDQIVVLDQDEETLEEAAQAGVVAVAGDASRESILKSVAIDRAAHLIICPGRDDTAVLIALTAHDLNPRAKLVATCRQEENARLLKRSSADTIVSPAMAGGNLMAAATRRAHLVETMHEILSVGGVMQLDEREIETTEAGKHPSQLKGMAVIRVYRGDRHFNVADLPALQEGDTIVFVTTSKEGSSRTGATAST